MTPPGPPAAGAGMLAAVCRAIMEDLSGLHHVAAPIPTPQEGEVLVRVLAAGVNFPDLLICQGLYQLKPDLPFIPGMDVAGDVVALGPGAAPALLGQRVAGGVRLGAFAAYACAPVAALTLVPDGLGADEAAAIPAAYTTAHVALHWRAALKPGETLLVHGAASGVGLAAVDLGLILGARVIATASSEEKRAFLKAYGAHAVLAPSGFREAVKDLTDGRGADVIYDPVGGDVFDESTRAIAFDGRLLVIGFAGGRIPTLAANMALIKGFSVMGVRAGEYGRRFPDRGRATQVAVWALAQAGRLRPHIHARYPLSRAREALLSLSRRDVIGKLVLTPEGA